jgi:predicted nuclease of predicted toxin-antitoxin system
VRILLDVNMSPLWLEYLRAAGHHAVLWTAIGAPRAPDSEIVRYAREQGFVIFSRDLDFGAILAASGAKLPSVIQLRGSGQFPQEDRAPRPAHPGAGRA